MSSDHAIEVLGEEVADAGDPRVGGLRDHQVEALLALLEEAAKLGLTYYTVSSVTGEGIQQLLRDLYDRVRAVHAEESIEETAEDGIEECADVAERTGGEA